MTKKISSFTFLEETFLILLSDIKPLLKQLVSSSNQWFLDSKNQQVVKTVKKHSFYVDQRALKKKKSYRKCKEAFEKDGAFKYATKLAGYWGKFETVLQTVVDESVKIKRGNIFIDEDRARQKIVELNSMFSQKTVKIEVHARLLGVNIKSKKVTFPNGVYLYRLNKKEINARQPLIQAYDSNALWTDPQITFHPTEIRYSMKASVDPSEQFAFFKAKNQAQQEARNAFQNLIESILLVQEGDVQLGPLSMEGGPIPSGISYSMETRLIAFPVIAISSKQTKQIYKAYELLSGDGEGKDKVLSRALQRFFIGRQRHNPVDKLIDYVISWEAILLTQKGSPIKQEMIYRFSVNGSSLLAYVLKNKDRKELFEKMKCAYATRSTVVHGGLDREIGTKLKAGSFLDLNDVCKFLEDSFRKTVWWLINFDRSKRPYHKDNGWEDLLWTN